MRSDLGTPERRLRSGGPDEIHSVARQLGAEFAERADRHDREGSYAPENIEALWAAGIGNVSLAAELGGVGADLVTSARAVEAIAMGDPSTALILVMHLSHLRLLTEGVDGWPDHLRDRVVTESLQGPALINALRVEPDLGTPSRGGLPATRAVPFETAEGQTGWRISGRKIYSTGSYGLRWMIVWAATSEDDPDGQRIGPFLVPGDAPGVSVVETWDHLGMRASASHDVVFRDVEVPADHAVGLVSASQTGGPPDIGAWGWTSVLLMRIYTGVAKAGRDWLAGYLNDRTPANLGASLATLPRFQAAMGEIESLIHTADRLLEDEAIRFDAGGEIAVGAAREAGLVKVAVTSNVIRALELGLGLIGNPGLSYHHPLQRHYRNVLCSRIHSPQDDVVLAAAGRSILAR